MPAAAPRAERIRWVPRQFGAWAILAVPLLLGVAATRPSPWHVVLAVAAACAYLAFVATLEWTRSRRPAQLRPAVVFGTGLILAGAILLTVQPALAWIAVFVVTAGAVTVAASTAGHPKSVVVSLVEVVQALALVPAAALVAGVSAGEVFEDASVARATLAAGMYLVGSVLVVRSLIRERGNRGFLVLSIAYHAAAVAIASWLLATPYGVLAAALLVRAVALPLIQRRQGARLRPLHIGIVEIVASLTLVGLAFSVGF